MLQMLTKLLIAILKQHTKKKRTVQVIHKVQKDLLRLLQHRPNRQIATIITETIATREITLKLVLIKLLINGHNEQVGTPQKHSNGISFGIKDRGLICTMTE